MTELRGNAAVRHVVAELLNTADWLAVNVRSVTARTWPDGTVHDADVWFHSYEDAQAFADHYGIGDRVTANGGDWTLLYLARHSYESGCPTIAGLRVGLRLTAERPAAA
jgi:hypothetical protein